MAAGFVDASAAGPRLLGTIDPLPESPIGMWKLEVARVVSPGVEYGFSETPLDGRVRMTAYAVLPLVFDHYDIPGTPTVPTLPQTSMTFQPVTGTVVEQGGGIDVYYLSGSTGTASHSNLQLRAGPGGPLFTYRPAESNSSLMVFRGTWPGGSEVTFHLTALDVDPFSATGGAESGWTEARVVHFLDVFEQYVQDSGGLLSLGDLWWDHYTDATTIHGGNWFKTMVDGLYGGPPGDQMPYLAMIYEAIKKTGDEPIETAQLNVPESDNFPGEWDHNPLQGIRPGLTDHWAWLTGPALVPSTGARSGVVFGPTFSFGLGLDVDLTWFAPHVAALHTVMICFCTLACCGRLWDEFRRQ